MMESKSIISKMAAPFASMMILVGLAALYFGAYIPARKNYLRQRNIRIMSVMGRQLSGKIESFENIFNSFVEDDSLAKLIQKNNDREIHAFDMKSKKMTQARFDALVENMTVHEVKVGRRGSSVDRFHVDEVRGKNQFELRFDFQRNINEATVAIEAQSSAFSDLFQDIVDRGEFDDVLLAKMTDTTRMDILFQKNSSGIKIDNLANARDPLGKRLTLADMAAGSVAFETVLLGRAYQLYSYPIHLSFQAGDRGGDYVADEHGNEKWALIGLLDSKRFSVESRRISESYVLLVILLVVLTVVSIPLFKLFFMGQTDTLGSLDLMLIGSSMLVLAALLIIAGLDFLVYRVERYKIQKNQEWLAESISVNFKKELWTAYKTLKELDERYHEKRFDFEKQADMFSNDSIGSYKNIEMVYWVDADGTQVKKWSIKKHVTPFISLKERSYFKRLRNGNGWSLQGKDHEIPEFYLQPIYSLTTGQNETIFSIPSISDSAKVAALDFRLLSLNQAILPPGYGFAVVDDQGDVLYHSDKKRNLWENFIDECEKDAELQAVIYARSQRHLDLQYFGKKHRLFVSPIMAPPWTLIIFYRPELVAHANAEMIAIACSLFTAYIVILLLARLFAAKLFPRLFAFHISSLWPQPKHQLIDQALVVLLTILCLLFVLSLNISAFNSFYVLLFDILLAIAGLLAFVMIRKQDDTALQLKKKFIALPSGRSYVYIWFGYLILLGILPAFTCFRIAHSLEVELVSKFNQRETAASLAQRLSDVSNYYKSVQFSDSTQKGIQKESFLKNRLRFSDGNRAEDIYILPTDSIWVSSDVEKGRSLHHEWEAELLKRTSLTQPGKKVSGELMNDSAGNSAWVWKHAGKRLVMSAKGKFATDDEVENGQILKMSSKLKTLRGAVFYSSNSLVGFIVLLILIGAGLYSLVNAILKRVFLPDLPVGLKRERLLDFLRVNSSGNLLITHCAADPDVTALPCNEFERYSLADLSCSQILANIKADSGKKRIVIEHFESGSIEPRFNAQKLHLLRELLHTYGRHVVVFSTIYPLPFAVVGESDQDSREAKLMSRQWKQAMTSFQHKILLSPGDASAFASEVNAILAQSKEADNSLLQAAARLIKKECGAVAQLQEIGLSICRNIFGRDISPSELSLKKIKLDLLERSRIYYYQMWKICSSPQKLALIDLAKDGFLNSGEAQVLSSLVEGGLVTEVPHIALMNDSFTKFLQQENAILSADIQASLLKSDWGKFRLPLGLAVVTVLAFLMLSQPSFFESTISIVATILAGTPAIMKFFSMMRNPKSEN